MLCALLDVLIGSGAKRTGEAGLVGTDSDLTVGSMLAGECDWGSMVCPPDSSLLSFTLGSPKSNTSTEDKSCGVCPRCATGQAVGCLDGGGGCRERLPQRIVDGKSSYYGRFI